MSETALFVVEVREEVTEALTGHEGRSYVSPPQDRERALELIALFLGRQPTVNGEREPIWHHAVAGGQRSIRLRRLV